MTAHTHNSLNGGIATSSAMVFDEIFDSSNMKNQDAVMSAECAHAKRPSRLVSQLADDCRAMMTMETAPESPVPSAELVTHATTANSDHAAANTITGRLSNIEYKYHVDATILGTGYHGSVRSCVDRTTGRKFAVKSISKNDPKVKPGALVREIMLLQEMDHDNIINLVDLFEDQDYVHLVTDLCTGGELFDRIVERSTNPTGGTNCFSEEEASKTVYQILKAVQYMHKQGVVHRDIKPENILLETKEEDSSIKIIDFGLARKHDVAEPPMSTIVGTPYYIAPEVLRKHYTKSCDVWSTGVVAYILLCGYPPFNGANNREVHDSVLTGQYSFPREDWKLVSKEARDFIRKMLKMNVERRMTIDEALAHPWITRFNDTSKDEVRDNLPSSNQEVAVKGLALPKRGLLYANGLSTRKVRKAMFGI